MPSFALKFSHMMVCVDVKSKLSKIMLYASPSSFKDDVGGKYTQCIVRFLI